MSSIKCPQCNLTNFATALTCKRCGLFFQASPFAADGVAMQNPAAAAAAQNSYGNSGGEQQNGAPVSGFQPTGDFASAPHPSFEPQPFQTLPQQNYQYRQQQQKQQSPPHYQNFHSTKQKSGLAIASMVLGLLGCFLTAPVGLILGIVAVVKANRYPREYGGKGFAVAGIALNGLGLLALPIVLAIAIPNLLAARRAANEASAIAVVRNLAAAEESYMSSMSGKCGDVQSLIATRLIDVSLAGNEKNGYRFLIVNFPAGGCEIHATPVTASHGTRSFYYSTDDGEIRAADKKGLTASADDPPLASAGDDFFGAEKFSPVNSKGLTTPNENAALAHLRTLSSAQATYAATIGQGNCGDLAALAREKFIRPDLADGEENGYRFTIKKLSPYGCDINATPTATAYRSFYVGNDGQVRGRMKNGLPADKNDPPLN